VNREAYLSYLEGRYFWNRRTAENIQRAFALFERSINKDPTYAPALRDDNTPLRSGNRVCFDPRGVLCGPRGK
jgi:hypothetical protein